MNTQRSAAADDDEEEQDIGAELTFLTHSLLIVQGDHHRHPSSHQQHRVTWTWTAEEDCEWDMFNKINIHWLGL